MVTSPPDGQCAIPVHPAHPAGHPHLIDGRALSELLTALDNDEDAVVHFVSTFVQQWPERLRRIADRIRARDTVGAVTAVLSIRVSSQILGASELTSLSTELEHLVRMDDFAAALVRVETLRIVGAETLRELCATVRESEPITLA